MKFFEFANILFSIIGGGKYSFTLDLLKAGLDADGVEYIKSLKSDESGKSRIWKYLSGKNDITELAPNIIGRFSQSLFVDYVVESIDESMYPELCKMFEASPYNITIEKYDVPQTLAEIYEDILKSAAMASKTNVSHETCKNKAVTNSKDIIQKYTFSLEEKTTISVIISYIDKNLYKLKINAEKYNSLDNEIKNGKVTEIQGLTDEMMIGFTEAEKEYQKRNVKPINEGAKRFFKEAAENQKISLKNDFDSFYSNLNGLFSELKTIIANKLEEDRYIKMLNDIADYFCNNIITIDKYFNPLTLSKINDFEKCVKYLKKE